MVLVREELREVDRAVADAGRLRHEIARHQSEQQGPARRGRAVQPSVMCRSARRRPRRRRALAIPEHLIERQPDEHRHRGHGRQDVVVELGAHHREEHERQHEPHEEQDRAVAPTGVAVLAPLPRAPPHPGHEAQRGQADPGEQAVAELGDVVAEARLLALVGVVHVREGAVEHVVEDQLVGERRAVPHVDGDVPGQRDDGDDEQAADDSSASSRPSTAPVAAT